MSVCLLIKKKVYIVTSTMMQFLVQLGAVMVLRYEFGILSQTDVRKEIHTTELKKEIIAVAFLVLDIAVT